MAIKVSLPHKDIHCFLIYTKKYRLIHTKKHIKRWFRLFKQTVTSTTAL
jgi:hypothetical protein